MKNKIIRNVFIFICQKIHSSKNNVGKNRFFSKKLI